MGYYINPVDCSKEEWLQKNARQVSSRDDAEEHRAAGLIPICLVDNGAFTAAGIGFSEDESDAFNKSGDWRPKKWFVATREAISAVCPNVNTLLE